MMTKDMRAYIAEYFREGSGVPEAVKRQIDRGCDTYSLGGSHKASYRDIYSCKTKEELTTLLETELAICRLLAST